ncbi:hypothetical protein PYCCODRAFT_1036849 [Trametes coccinea BRFM310]|uniref:Uncharacterized protein n=1 Tax=Trametes coccinea (strain BRFM310) TaxID=1353009 RepID=A0A1Y2IBR9_TRAC3|nr:hypothetical protein PYCCODRAFT_1036849 [Trametes coccinea BRFM310]
MRDAGGGTVATTGGPSYGVFDAGDAGRGRNGSPKRTDGSHGAETGRDPPIGHSLHTQGSCMRRAGTRALMADNRARCEGGARNTSEKTPCMSAYTHGPSGEQRQDADSDVALTCRVVPLRPAWNRRRLPGLTADCAMSLNDTEPRCRPVCACV